MALMPILAFFFCSAGPFLFFLFLVKKIFLKLRSCVQKDKKDILDINANGFQPVKTDSV